MFLFQVFPGQATHTNFCQSNFSIHHRCFTMNNLLQNRPKINNLSSFLFCNLPLRYTEIKDQGIYYFNLITRDNPPRKIKDQRSIIAGDACNPRALHSHSGCAEIRGQKAQDRHWHTQEAAGIVSNWVPKLGCWISQNCMPYHQNWLKVLTGSIDWKKWSFLFDLSVSLAVYFFLTIH